MFDIGVNLDHSSFIKDLAGFQQEYQSAGIQGIICISSNYEEAQKLIELCHNRENMHYTLGCHPHYASSWKAHHFDAYKNLFQLHSKAVAVGEMGLDFNRNYSTQSEQLLAFEAQIELANNISRPAYLHERDAFKELSQRLQVNRLKNSGVIHCFTGDKEQLKTYLDLGLFVGITGWLLDERRNQDLAEALKYLPMDRLLIETDAPYLLPRNIRPRPKRNHPKFLGYIAQAIAEIKNIDLESIKHITAQNTQKLFFSSGQ
ncbi:TatD family hydrolase [Marinomonas ostreistagni]|uniref:TatD family hydrolase n=1 Tax=Marinomonas ostreistagni TaxID=359209 RepID=A0ABS0Z6X6_9GAMM|nr:TatD family hydrolase [Marinomonas ostreistagni]MBJ7549406.1 TatD family hydrolase [Marinomonas ostreistagni]